MNEQQHDKPTPKTYLVTAENHLDYVQSSMETKLPEHDGNGVLGVLELGGSTDGNNHGFVDTQGSRMILVDVDSARFGPLAEFVGQFNEQTTPKGSIAAIDVRSLESPEGIDGFTKGVMLLKPSDEPHTLGRRVDENRDLFKWDEQTAGGISSKHLDIRVAEDGVFVRDRDSTNQTVLGTGEYGEKMIKNTPEHHEHVARIKELLGIEAVENTVELDGGNEAKEFDENELSSHKIIEGILNGDGMVADKLRELGSNPAEIQKALAYGDGSNEEIRMGIVAALGVKMRQLMNEGGHFHERVQDNAKNNEITMKEGPYKHKVYGSEDYVELLALAKLDGSFIVAKNRNTGVSENDQHAGQHRQAADALLRSLTGEATEPTSEIIATENEAIKRYVDDMKRRFDAILYPTNNLRSQLDSVVQDLTYARFDEMNRAQRDEFSDTVRRSVIDMFGVLDDLTHRIPAEIRRIDTLKESIAQDASLEDMQKLDTIYNDVKNMASKIEFVRQASKPMFTLDRIRREHDDMLIITAQSHARQNHYQEAVTELQNIASIMTGYVNG